MGPGVGFQSVGTRVGRGDLLRPSTPPEVAPQRPFRRPLPITVEQKRRPPRVEVYRVLAAGERLGERELKPFWQT